MEAATTDPDAQQAAPPPRLREPYENELVGQLTEKFGYSSRMQVPRLLKITVNMGVGDAKQSTPILEAATEQLATITGQHPNVRRARKSIANFKLREGMPVGVSVTLRGARMWEFLDRLISIAIPRIRDFRGLNPRSFDGRGNYSLGVREQLIFPEIDYDSIDEVRGLDIAITTTAATDEEGFELLLGLGMPFAAGGPPRRGRHRRRGRGGAPPRGGPRCGPRPSRRRSSSSRRRTPRPTPSPSGPRRARRARRARPRRRRRRLQATKVPRSNRWRRRHRRSRQQRRAQVQDPRVQPLPQVRPLPRLLPQVRPLPDLPARAAHQGYVPGMSKASW